MTKNIAEDGFSNILNKLAVCQREVTGNFSETDLGKMLK